MLIAAIGIIPYSLGFIIKFFQLLDPNLDVGYVAVFFLTIGWYPMVTGERNLQEIKDLANSHRPIRGSLVPTSSAQQLTPHFALDAMDDYHQWCRLTFHYYCPYIRIQ
jgi:hypothetical protein